MQPQEGGEVQGKHEALVLVVADHDEGGGVGLLGGDVGEREGGGVAGMGRLGSALLGGLGGVGAGEVGVVAVGVDAEDLEGEQATALEEEVGLPDEIRKGGLEQLVVAEVIRRGNGRCG